jgi:hypothetical protein
MSSNTSFTREEMIEPIERMFEREYPTELGLFEVLEEETEGGDGNVDLVYIQGTRESLHSVRIEESYDSSVLDINRGMHSLHDVDANFVWIALPLYEFRDGEDLFNDVMMETCRERGYGIITVQTKGRGISAKFVLEADEIQGSFIESYGPIAEKWEEAKQTELVEDQFKVVDYYGG